MLRHVGDVFRRDVRVVRQVEAEVMHLVGDRQVRDAVLLDPERLAAHRPADERTALDALSQHVLRDLKTVLGVGAEGEARDEAALAGLRPELRQGLAVELEITGADLGDLGQALQLQAAEVGVEVGRAQVVAGVVEAVELTEVIDLEFLLPGLTVGFRHVARPAVRADGEHHAIELVVAGGDGAALDGRDMVAVVEGEGAGQGKRTGLDALVFRTEGFAGVFDDQAAVLGAEAADGVHLVRVAEDVDEDEERGLLLLQELLEVVEVDAEVLGVGVAEEALEAHLHEG